MNASRSAHHQSLSRKYGPTAKLFLITAIILFLVSSLRYLTRPIGDTPIDFYNRFHGKSTIWGVGSFVLLDPIFFAVFAVIYAACWKCGVKGLSRLLIQVHFWTSVTFAVAVLWLARPSIDLYNPAWLCNWPPFFRTQLKIFGISRWVFAVGQLAFITNLARSLFRRSDTQPA